MKRAKSILCGVLAAVMMAVPAVAAEQTTTIPVTLTVVHTVHAIDVTMPVALPVSVLDGKVLTANNVSIKNNSRTDGVEVCGIRVEGVDYVIGDYDAFSAESEKTIALRLNGCATKGPGALSIDNTAFPVIAAESSLGLSYDAKVSDSGEVKGVEAARVIFTLRAVL